MSAIKVAVLNATKPVRLQNLAEKASVSRATASLALSDAPIILADRRSDRATSPTPMASALTPCQRTPSPVRRTHSTLAMLLRFSRNGPWEAHLPPSLLRGAALRAEQRGYQLEQFWIEDMKLTSRQLNRLLDQRRIPGVIIAPFPAAKGHPQLDWQQFSAVALDFSLARPVLHRVTTNRFDAMRLAVHKLHRLGYRRPGLALHAAQDLRAGHHWSAAFLWEQQKAVPSQRIPLFLAAEKDWTKSKFADWFGTNRPDVILGDDPAIITWLEALGKHVPDDAGFVQLWIQDPSSHYTGTYTNPPALGAAAVDMLAALIQRNERNIPNAPHTVLLPASWVDGETTKPACRPQSRPDEVTELALA